MATSVDNQSSDRSTPGVYVTEIPATGSSIVGVATAVPIFVGYTQFAGDRSGAPLYLKPVAISSMAEFEQCFGGPLERAYSIEVIGPAAPGGSATAASSTTPPPGGGAGPAAASPIFSFDAHYTAADAHDSRAASARLHTFAVVSKSPAGPVSPFSLHRAMQLFFANGGESCWVVSVGSYWDDVYPTAAPEETSSWRVGQIRAGGANDDAATHTLVGGISAAGYAIGPTMLVTPEACLLTDNANEGYNTVVQAMLEQAGRLQDRVAILDLPGCLTARTVAALQTCQAGLATAAPQAANLSYGVAYAPALKTSIVTSDDVLFSALVAPAGGNAVMNNILTAQAAQLHRGRALGDVQAAIAAAFPVEDTARSSQPLAYSGDPAGYPAYDPAKPEPTLAQWRLSLDNYLRDALPIFAEIKQQIADSLNVAVPSAALAGCWAASDALNGVWTAPADLSLAQVVSPLCEMDDAEQAGFAAPSNGQAINVLRAVPGRGVVVRGARTLDGDSLDYLCIEVRRTLIYVEQSIKAALQPYVFAANDATTWSTVVTVISDFLTGLWREGGLMGATPSEAFTVGCGLGSTMTAQNILDGYMIVAVTLQMAHPAEVIALTFKQTMGG